MKNQDIFSTRIQCSPQITKTRRAAIRAKHVHGDRSAIVGGGFDARCPSSPKILRFDTMKGAKWCCVTGNFCSFSF